MTKTPKMTKAHFEMIAKVLSGIGVGERCGTWFRIRYELAVEFQKANSHFNFNRFMIGCLGADKG